MLLEENNNISEVSKNSKISESALLLQIMTVFVTFFQICIFCKQDEVLFFVTFNIKSRLS